jgi:4-hydroxyphenylpyruvate dioxygenase
VLVARFDLPAARVAELRDLSLLYDRDADGEFVPLSTPIIGEVFFEAVERRGRYDGYDAANTPTRWPLRGGDGNPRRSGLYPCHP